MIKKIPLKYLIQFVARMYNKECPEYYAEHRVVDIRKAIIETFNVGSSIYFNVGNEDIIVELPVSEYNWTFKEFMRQCEESDDGYTLNNLNIIWDALQEFKNSC